MTINNASIHSRVTLQLPKPFFTTLAGTTTAAGGLGYFSPQNGTFSTLAGTTTAAGGVSTWSATVLSNVTTTPTVTIDGRNLTGATLSGIRVTNGRDSLNTQPQPSYASLQLIDTTLSAPELLGRDVIVNLGTQPIFTGVITDVRITTQTIRPWSAAHTITAVGRLRDLNKPIGPQPASTESERIYNVLSVALGKQWQRTTGTWSEQTQKWNALNNGSVTPGGYQIAATTETSTGTDLANSAANDGGGVICDTNNGQIVYQSAFTRNSTYWALNAVDIDASLNVELSSVSTSTQLGDVINDVSVSWTGGTQTATDANSANVYGVQSTEVKTNLTNEAQAAERAAQILARYAQPRQHLDRVEIPLNILDLADTSNLRSVYVGMPIQLVNLPTLLGGQSSSWRGYVEGYEWNLNHNDLWISLNISEYSLSTIAMRWSDVDVTQKFSMLDRSVTWNNYLVRKILANSPYFSWTTPDDSAYVIDGSAAIRSLANQIDNALQTYSSILLSPAIAFATATGQMVFTFASNTSTSLGVTFPTSRFTVAPKVFFYTSPATTTPTFYGLTINSVTTTTLTVTIYAPAVTIGTKTVDYHAVQQLATNALG